jgi:hypothetical protein
MAILLDGTSGTRTSRWLKVAPQSAVRHISTIGVIGVPLAFVVARQYERGKASFYGIPEEFVASDRSMPLPPSLPSPVYFGCCSSPCMKLSESA